MGNASGVPTPSRFDAVFFVCAAGAIRFIISKIRRATVDGGRRAHGAPDAKYNYGMINRKNAPIAKINSALKRACAAHVVFKAAALVFGDGRAPCGLMVVGEAPGRDETKEGRPFVGKAGRFFCAILEDALGAPRGTVYITNVVKRWPTIETKRKKTRPPSKEELAFFKPYLLKEIEAVRPRVILAVGKTAFAALAPDDAFTPGQWVETEDGLLIMPVYHPAYIQRRQKELQVNIGALKTAIRKVRLRLNKAGTKKV